MEILLGDNTYSLDRIGLRLWLELEDIREKVLKAAENGNADEMGFSICSYISVALDVSIEEISDLPWYELAEAYVSIALLCIPAFDFAVLKPREQEEKRKVSWEYEGRTFYLWSHLLASSYGWSIEYIADMYFNDALALLQEILVDEQLKKEWEWGLSELAYPYDPSSKKSKFHPLPRPSWMSEDIILSQPKNMKIPKFMMPVGIIKKLDTNETIIN